jgi:hypothetical protein
MLNESQRTYLRIVLRLIEEKMRAIEFRLANPQEHGLMFEVSNDMTPEMERWLREKVAVVYSLIMTLRDRFALPVETKQASREVAKGLSSQHWVALKESDSRSLRRYGPIDAALAPVLDPLIETLARLMLELEDQAVGKGEATLRATGENVKHSARRSA